MSDEVPSVPDWTRWAKVSDLDELRGDPYMLRLSDDADSPWGHVKTRTRGWWVDEETGTEVSYETVKFHNEDAERVLNPDDDIEVGLIRPPWWSPEQDPPEWPRR